MQKTCCLSCILLIVATLFPPIAILMDDGCGIQFLLNILLCFFGIIPGIIHAYWVCFCREPEMTPLNQQPIVIVNRTYVDEGRPL
uniref:UPF0057 membrane protein n=1 Tax=Parastrongyloides trichosuri TaxID=131310 RepID=A0A0N4ZNA2_PARTI